MKSINIITLPLLGMISMPLLAQTHEVDSLVEVVKPARQLINVGANKSFSLEESTASVSVIGNKSFNHRGGKNIGYDIVGQGLGMFSKEEQGVYGDANVPFIVRGLQSLSGSSPLLLVDGIQRSLNEISPEEVESVTVLKDAAAVALYGHLAANGAVLVTTKRGEYNSRNIKFSYDHVTALSFKISWMYSQKSYFIVALQRPQK